MNTSRKVEAAMARGEVGVTKKEEDFLLGLHEKYPSVLPGQVSALTHTLQRFGWGRNENTAATLRMVADMIEGPIETAESIEARLDGKLQ